MPELTLAEQIRLKEYESLRGEIKVRGDSQNSIERNTALAVAAIYSFLASLEKIPEPAVEEPQAATQLVPVIWWVPFALLLYGFFRWRANGQAISHLGDFIREKVAEESWQKYNAGKHNNYWRLVRASWIIAIIATALVALKQTAPGLWADYFGGPYRLLWWLPFFICVYALGLFRGKSIGQWLIKKESDIRGQHEKPGLTLWVIAIIVAVGIAFGPNLFAPPCSG